MAPRELSNEREPRPVLEGDLTLEIEQEDVGVGAEVVGVHDPVEGGHDRQVAVDGVAVGQFNLLLGAAVAATGDEELPPRRDIVGN